MSYDDGSHGVGGDEASVEGDAGGSTSDLLAALSASVRRAADWLDLHPEERPRLYINQQIGVFDGQVEVISGPLGEIGGSAETEASDERR